MDNIYKTLRERARNKSDDFIQVPIHPSMGMVLAAYDAADVIEHGDTLSKWFDTTEQILGGSDAFINQELIDRFGFDKALRLAIIADLWTCTLGAFESWFDRRRSYPRHLIVEGKEVFYCPPNAIPEGGWPKTKEGITDLHEQAAKAIHFEFPLSFEAFWHLDRRTSVVALKHMPYFQSHEISCMQLSTSVSLEFCEIFATHEMPTIPGWGYSGPYTDEERSIFCLSAIWRACIKWLLDENASEDFPFPFHQRCQAITVSHELSHYIEFRQIERFYYEQPFGKIEFSGEGFQVSAKVQPNGLLEVNARFDDEVTIKKNVRVYSGMNSEWRQLIRDGWLRGIKQVHLEKLG